MYKFIFNLLIISLLPYFSTAQKDHKQRWVDSVYNSMSTQERFGQLLMLRTNQAYQAYDPKISTYIKTYGIGGLCFFAYDPVKQVAQTTQWQQLSKTPLLIGIDAEWGLGMRHRKHTISYPYQMTLGAVNNDSLIYRMGCQIGEQCLRMGIQMNFAPVVDVNNNPNNPVINSRSFGDTPELVAAKATHYMRGLQAAGVMATAKHFPGHGDTDTDSHLGLPTITHPLARLERTELAPYRQLIKQGLRGIMVAHLYVPALETEPHVASTLSHAIVSKLLKQQMGFKGLIVTDALDMKGVTKHFSSGEIEVRAFLAGNDILLLPADVPAAIQGLMNAYKTDRISEPMLAERCKKILALKYELGLHSTPQTSSKNLLKDLNKNSYKQLRKQLFREAITLVKNDNFLPLKATKDKRIAIVNIGSTKAFGQANSYLKTHCKASIFYLAQKLSKADTDSISHALSTYHKVVFNIGHTNIFPQKDFGIQAQHISCIYATAKRTATAVNLLGSPLAAQKYFSELSPLAAFVLSYQDTPDTRLLSAQMLCGQLGFRGSLPISLSTQYPQGSGLHTALTPQKHSASTTSHSQQMLQQIDSLVHRGISMQAFPGCQIYIMHKGKPILNKAYGYFTYDSIHAVDTNTLYDLASLTKVLASAPVLMYLYQRKLIDLDMPIESFLPQLRNTNKATLTWRNILSHQARLQAWIPYYKFYTDPKDSSLDSRVFATHYSPTHSQKVAQKLYINPQYEDAMFDSLATSPLRPKTEYCYSDLGYYWVPSMTQRLLRFPFEDFLIQHFYQPLGLSHTMFRPLASVPAHRIAPTEEDKVFRNATIQGYVHDPGAAMLGGLSGHAGLFSNAQEVATIFQMYLQGGHYQGQQLLDSATIDTFTRHQFPQSDNRRALCFDKPYETYDPKGPCCEAATQSSFGHSGFTGTYVWADPAHELVYVFLSNRTYPNSSNWKISRYNFRTDIQAAIYRALAQ